MSSQEIPGCRLNVHDFSVMRLRQEVQRLIITQAGKLKDPAQSAAYLASTYEILLQHMSVSAFTKLPNLHMLQTDYFVDWTSCGDTPEGTGRSCSLAAEGGRSQTENESGPSIAVIDVSL